MNSISPRNSHTGFAIRENIIHLNGGRNEGKCSIWIHVLNSVPFNLAIHAFLFIRKWFIRNYTRIIKIFKTNLRKSAVNSRKSIGLTFLFLYKKRVNYYLTLYVQIVRPLDYYKKCMVIGGLSCVSFECKNFYRKV